MKKVEPIEVKPKPTIKAPVKLGTEVKKDIEVLPKEVDLLEEAKKVGAKRIAPDRVEHQQLTPEKGIASIKADFDSILSKWDKFDSKLDIKGGSQKKIDEYLKYKADITSGKYTGARLKMLEDYMNNPMNKRYFDKLEMKIKLNNLFGKEYINLPKAIEKLKSLSDQDIKAEYISRIKKDISKGYKYPDEVLNYDKSFKTAVDNRERYEKGLATSFSADDSRIVFDNRTPIGMKRQDGKPIEIEKIDEIVNGLKEFSKNTGIDIEKIFKEDKIVIAHLNGKSPFLSKYAGLYRQSGENKSLSIGGVEKVTFKNKMGEMETKDINTIMSHELGHAIDFMGEERLFNRAKHPNLKGLYEYNKGKDAPLEAWYRNYLAKPEEVRARMIEQYVGIKQGQSSYYERVGYWKKELFDDMIPEIEKGFKDKFSDSLIKK